MGTEEFLLEEARLEGKAQGFAQGRQEGVLEEKEQMIKNLIEQMGLSDLQAAKIANASVSFAKDIRRRLAA